MRPANVPRRRLDYPWRVPIVACPFCREMFEQGEASVCTVCGMELKPLEKLPPVWRDDDGLPESPEHEPLSWTYLGRGKGLLSLFAFVGMVLFFLPWIEVTLPDSFILSGFDLARVRGWQWGAFIGWMVLVPTILSRRSVAQMRGARVAAAFLAAIPGVTVAIFLAFPQKGGLVPVRFVYVWPFWTTLACSLAGLLCALRLGGRIDDIPVTRGTSVGQHVH